MDHQPYLSDGSNSLVAFILIALIGVTTLALLPRGNKESQLLWIVSCLALSLFEAVTDNAPLSQLDEAVAAFLATLIVSVMLSEHAQVNDRQRVSRPVSLLICIAFSSVAQIAHLLGLAGSGEIALSMGSLIAACCWPLLVHDVASRAPSHDDREYLSALLLTYALMVMSPAVEGAQPGGGRSRPRPQFPSSA